MELSKKQLEIINAKEDKIVVIASAAAGKTAVLTERIRYLINNGVNPKELVAITFTNLAAEEIRERVGDIAKDCFIGTVHSYCNYLLISAGVETRELLDEEQFDELFEKIKEHPECIKYVDHLLLDEAQDSNYAQFEFLIDSIQPKHFMLVGDHRQCQPEGTKVLLFDGTEKNIENLSVGDKVIAYDSYKGRIAGGAANNAKNGIVSQISKRYVENEELITITTDDGKTSKYTKNHICITNLCRYDKYNFLVYLMCDKNNRFRVGTSQLKNTRTCPWRSKMIAEECEQIWIIDTFMTNKEARVLEDKISYLYGIPQVTFQLDKTSYTQDDLDYIYDGLNTYESAKKCLNDFHRDIRYPFSRKGDNIHYAGNAFNKCYACNILPHNMTIMEFCKESYNRKKIACIENLYYENYTGYVYSLDIEKYHSYIADGIVTHNCIYRFNSSDPQALINLTKQPDVKVYSLNENYRNGIKILDYAKMIIRQNGYDYLDNSIPMRKIDGRVVTVEYSPTAIARTIKKMEGYKNWFILSRWNKDIEQIANACEATNVPYSIIRKKDFSSNEELRKKMEEDTVKIMTIHASKGLEADNVVVIGATFNKKGANEEKEENLCVNYVAATRAKDLLVWTYKHQYRKDAVRSWE